MDTVLVDRDGSDESELAAAMIHLPYRPHHRVSPIRGLKLTIHIILDTVQGFLNFPYALPLPVPETQDIAQGHAPDEPDHAQDDGGEDE